MDEIAIKKRIKEINKLTLQYQHDINNAERKMFVIGREYHRLRKMLRRNIKDADLF